MRAQEGEAGDQGCSHSPCPEAQNQGNRVEGSRLVPGLFGRQEGSGAGVGKAGKGRVRVLAQAKQGHSAPRLLGAQREAARGKETQREQLEA